MGDEKLTANIDTINENVVNLENEIKTIDIEYKENQLEFGNMTELKNKLNSERVVVSDKLQKLHHDLRFMEIGIRDNNKEKQQNEVLQTLQKLFSGIYGRLRD